jgi:pilus assembly protein CpaE
MAKVPEVMIVDPDWERASDLQRLLQQVGLPVVANAGYGIEAFTLARQVNPDVVLMRVEEPLVRPVQTLQRMTDGVPGLQVIVYSAQTSMDIVRQVMLAGASDVLQDPLKAEDVEQAIWRLLERKAQRGDATPAQGEGVALGTVVTVFGAKGGIGKTTIASNLAIALAQEASQSVALVDMDTRFGDVAITMDIPVELSIADLARDLDSVTRESLPDYLVRHDSGVNILPAPTRPSDWKNMTAQQIHEVIDVLAQTHDFVVLDTPGTFNEIVAAAIEAGTMILLITTLDMTSIKDTVLALEMLYERFPGEENRIRVVLNRAGMDLGVREQVVERTLTTELWWKIPEDIEVARAGQIGRPIVISKPNTRVALEMRDMAASLAGVRRRPREEEKKKSRRGGLSLGRLIRPLFRKSA